MKKRAVSLALTLVMALSVVVLPAGAAGKNHTFGDISRTHWASGAVQYVYENGLMSGTSDTTFRPNGTLSRAMFVTILGRVAHINANNYRGKVFSDVPTGQWYSGYVAWAYEKGIVSGRTATQFYPNSAVTREQMASMLARYAEVYKVNISTSGSAVSSFRDAASISAYARNGVELMRRTGIITGDSSGYFNPKKTATRAEAAVVFMRLSAKTGGPAEIDKAGAPYLVEYIGMTVRDVTNIWGSDYKLGDIYFGGQNFYYDDWRIPALLYIPLEDMIGNRIPSYAKITLLEVIPEGNAYVGPNVPDNATYTQLRAQGAGPLEYTDGGGNFDESYGAIYRYKGVEAWFIWYLGKDPYTNPADFILI